MLVVYCISNIDASILSVHYPNCFWNCVESQAKFFTVRVDLCYTKRPTFDLKIAGSVTDYWMAWFTIQLTYFYTFKAHDHSVKHVL